MHPNSVLHDCFSHGDMTELAGLLGCSPQHVSAYCSADGPASPYAQFLAWLLPVSSTNPAAAQKILDDAQIRLESWRGQRGRRPGGGRRTSLEDLAGGVAKETADLVVAKLGELPRRQQRDEALDVITAAQRFIRALDDEDRFEVKAAAGGRS